MSVLPDTSLVAFKAIVNFTNNLFEEFGEEHKCVKLYNHLLSKTTLSHDTAIQKHISCFRTFCIENRESITNFDIENIKGDITYSNRVYLDIKNILKASQKDTQKIIWQHLLIISVILDPTGKAKQILQQQKEESQNVDGEANFLTDIIDKIESNVDPNSSNPMEAVSTIMQSGVFNDLVQGMGSGLHDGSLDLNKLMGTVQNMVTKLNDEVEEDDKNTESVNMINSMMQNLTSNLNKTSENGEMPDIANMLGPMMNAAGEEGQAPDIASMLGPMMNATGEEGQAPDIASMLGPMMNASGEDGQAPDIASMLGPMMNMMGNMNNLENPNSSSTSIEDKISLQLEQAKKNGDI
jgi:hypothetical protein|uniref:Uncharacterized protein n=1 Tax=viral metagenome TaxID=1070528 RepID=A0A6C0J1K7_9ZZZZ